MYLCFGGLTGGGRSITLHGSTPDPEMFHHTSLVLHEFGHDFTLDHTPESLCEQFDHYLMCEFNVEGNTLTSVEVNKLKTFLSDNQQTQSCLEPECIPEPSSACGHFQITNST